MSNTKKTILDFCEENYIKQEEEDFEVDFDDYGNAKWREGYNEALNDIKEIISLEETKMLQV